MAPPPGYHLVWSDEFNGSLNNTKWEVANYSPTRYYWLPCATSDNAYTSNGKLVLRIKKGTCPGDRNYGYNSGIVSSRQSWKYGYFEIMAKLPAGLNINSAFWFLGKGWDGSHEIDMFETGGIEQRPYKLNMSYKTSDVYTGPDHSLEYTIFGLEWTPNYIRWVTDCVERRRFNATSSNPTPDVPMIIILSIYKGWHGQPDLSILPKYYNIEYVRVYQK